MAREQFTLVVQETEVRDGIDAAVLSEDGQVTASAQVSYGDYSLAVSGEEPPPTRQEVPFSAATRRLRLQCERRDTGFEFCAIGDDEELARATVADADWQLVAARASD
jgi:hypothetical protein